MRNAAYKRVLRVLQYSTKITWATVIERGSHDSSGSVVADYGLDSRGSIPDRGFIF
jgi:hypothetical protein